MKIFLLLIIGLALSANAQGLRQPSATDLLASGKYSVGFRRIVREDATRTFTPKSGAARARPVRMFVWYPARKIRGKQPLTFRAYVEAEGRGLSDAAPRFRDTVGGGAELSETQLQTILDSPTRAFADAARASGRFPVVLLGGGLNGAAYHHTLLAEYLASHGYVVAALSTLPEREGDRLAFNNKTGLGLLVGDLEFALRELAGDSQVDVDRLGLAGWSVGGVALAALAARDTRVDGVVSLDSGLSYDYGLSLLDEFLPARQSQSTPVLDLRGLVPNSVAVARDAKYFDSVTGEVIRVNIASLNHVQCTSLALLVSGITGVGDKAESRTGYRALAAYTKAFLDHHVRGDRRAAAFLKRDPAGNGFPEGIVTVGTVQAGQAKPSARSGYAIAYDSRNRRMVLYGGMDSQQKRLSDMWTWDGREWRQIGGGGPGQRLDAFMAFDSKRGRVVLFGGSNDKERLGDTWEFDGTKWESVASKGPGARILGAMAYDEKRGRVVLFGGQNAQRQKPGDTWEWDGKQWKQTSAAGPPPRSSHNMVYHAKRRTVILTGGFGEQILGDMWEWNGKSWTQLPRPELPPRLHFAFGYDSRRERLVVFGGFGQPGRVGDTWEWDGKTWQQFKSDGPAARAEHEGVYFPDHGFIVFGGIEGQGMAESERTRVNDLWQWSGSEWKRLSP